MKTFKKVSSFGGRDIELPGDAIAFDIWNIEMRKETQREIQI
jgi:hypothetical protein